MFKNKSLKAKLLTLNLVVNVVSIALFWGMAIQQQIGSDSLRTAMTHEATEAYLDKIDRNLFERYGDVQAYALSEPARSGNSQRIEAFMNDMMGAYTPIYDLMMVVNLQGKVIAINSVDKNGKPLEVKWMLGHDYSSEEWFQAAIKDKIKPGTAHIMSMHKEEEVARAVGSDGYVMNFTAPIRDKDTGRILGVWTNRMSWADVVASITKEEMGALRRAMGNEHVQAALLDSEGRYILHPDAASVGKVWEEFAQMKALADHETQITAKEDNLSGHSAKYYEGITKSKGYSIYPGQGWYARVFVPAEDFMITLSWIWTIVGALLQVGGFLFGWWMISGISRRLGGLTEELEGEGNEVGRATEGIKSGSIQLSNSVTSQASALQETASSVEEMNAMVKKSAENAQRSQQVAQSSQQAALRGKQAVDEMTQAIDRINTSNEKIMGSVEDSNQKITEIVKVITEIGNKTKVINDIVFQTKLLSFNASVEAARAGEHGKGFAVVAEEVGNLAQMSGNAAKEIADMLNGSIQKVESIVEETKRQVERLITEGKQELDSGKIVARQCGEILEEVVQNVSSVNEMVSEISTAAREQSLGIGEITKAMAQLDQITHENAGNSRDTAGSADRLSGQARHLLEVVRELESIVQGEKAGYAPREDRRAERLTEMANDPIEYESPKARPEPKVELKMIKSEPSGSHAPLAAKNPPPVKTAAASGGKKNVPTGDDPRFSDL